MFKCAKNHTNWFRYFEDVKHSDPVLWPTLYIPNCITRTRLHCDICLTTVTSCDQTW